MRALLLVLATTLAFPAGAFKDTTFGFEVAFPKGEVLESPILVRAPFKGRLFQVVGNKVERFGVSTVRYPTKIESTREHRRKYIDDVRDRLVGRLKGTVVLERELALGDHAGREITVRTTALQDFVGFAVLYTQRVFLVDDRYFSVFTVSRAPGDAQRRFLDSFKVSPDPGAPDATRFEMTWAEHDDGARYLARLPASHLIEGPDEGTRALELSEDASALAITRIYRMRNSPLLFAVSTARFTDGVVTEKTAESLLNAARVDAADALQLNIESAQVAIVSKTERELTMAGVQSEGERLSVRARVILRPEALYTVAVYGPKRAIKSSDADQWLARFKPSAPE